MDIRNLHRDGRWHAPFLPCWKPEDGPHPRRRPRTLCFEALLALMMLMMLACTAVQDPSERWKMSGMDPRLEGKWVAVAKKEGNEEEKKVDEKEASKMAVFAKHEGGYYFYENDNHEGDDDAFAVRTFIANKKNFMLLVFPDAAQNGFEKAKEENRGGIVWFYELDGDTLKIKMIANDALDQAIHAGKIAGTTEKQTKELREKKKGQKGGVADNGPSIATLDDATCDALAELTKDDKAWLEVSTFKRVKADAPAKKPDEKPPENPAAQ